MARRRDRRYDVAGFFNTIKNIAKKKSEAAELKEEMSNKDFFRAIGSTIGSLGAMALTGGAINPVTLGLITGGASYVGGKIGANQEKINPNRYRFLKEDAEEFNRYIDKQITGQALRTGVTSGMQQAADLTLAGKGYGDLLSADFQDSLVSKSFKAMQDKIRVNKLADEGLVTLDKTGNLITSPEGLPGVESGKEFMSRVDQIGSFTDEQERLKNIKIALDKMKAQEELESTRQLGFQMGSDMMTQNRTGQIIYDESPYTEYIEYGIPKKPSIEIADDLENIDDLFNQSSMRDTKAFYKTGNLPAIETMIPQFPEPIPEPIDLDAYDTNIIDDIYTNDLLNLLENYRR